MATVGKLESLDVDICLDTRNPDSGPGTYSGALLVGGKGIVTTTIPLTVTLKSGVGEAILWAALGALLGLVVNLLIDVRKAGGSLGSYFKKANAVPFVVSLVVAGLLVGIYGVLITYGTNDAWGTSSDHWQLFAAGIAGQIAGMSVLNDLVAPYTASS
jgi:hypothetical protein